MLFFSCDSEEEKNAKTPILKKKNNFSSPVEKTPKKFPVDNSSSKAGYPLNNPPSPITPSNQPTSQSMPNSVRSYTTTEGSPLQQYNDKQDQGSEFTPTSP